MAINYYNSRHEFVMVMYKPIIRINRSKKY